MREKDHYKILGVSENASLDEIRKAYRNLALKHHPDRNARNKREAEERFKEISEAYHVLSDPKRKQEYDAINKNRDSDHLFSDIFEDLFGGLGGTTKVWHYSSGPQNSPYSGHKTYTAPRTYATSDIHATLEIPKQLALSGGQVKFRYAGGKNVTVKIPPNTRHGQKLRLPRAGEDCPACSHPGDLILKVKAR